MTKKDTNIRMKKRYIIPKFCVKHKVHHGPKFPSCILERERDFRQSFQMTTPTGVRVDVSMVGKLRASDIALLTKILKNFHISTP